MTLAAVHSIRLVDGGTHRRLSACLLFVTLLTSAAAAETWSSIASVSQNADENKWAGIRGDAQGWHYTYMKGDIENSSTYRMYYRVQSPGGVWSAPVQIGSIPQSEESRTGRFSDGTQFIVFQGKPGSIDEFMYSENAGAGWSTPGYFTPNDGARDLCTNMNRILDVDTADAIHLLCQHEANGVWNMRYYVKPRGGAIQDLGDVYDSGYYQLNGSVRATGSGADQRVHFLVAGSGASTADWRCHYRRWNNPGWSAAVNLSNLVTSTPRGAHAGNIVQRPDGQLVACFANNDGAPTSYWEIWLLFSDDNGTSWHSPTNISQNSGLSRAPSCSVDSTGDVVVAWEDDSDGGQMKIMARRWHNGALGPRFILSHNRGFDVDIASHGTKTRAAWHSDAYGTWQIVTSETDAVDTIPPGPVTQFTALPGNTKVTLSWNNPFDADFTGTALRFSTSGLPTNISDGLPLADVPSAPGTGGTYGHTGLTNGVTYYYAAFAHDQLGNFSGPATVMAVPYGPADFDHDGDVDQDDFGYFQTCMTGASEPQYEPRCTDAKFDTDSDVDQDDLAKFRNCFSGPGVPALANCAN